eukprot:m.83508 g.83508  ORF g.83508 m.83508 type:complete len:146 (-) comp8163_c1_seq1:199-636(-)
MRVGDAVDHDWMLIGYRLDADWMLIDLQLGLLTYPYPVQGNEGKMKVSQRTAAAIDHEVNAIVRKAYDRALAIMADNRSRLGELMEMLLAKSSITQDDLARVLGPKRVRHTAGVSSGSDNAGDAVIGVPNISTPPRDLGPLGIDK